MLSAVFSDTNLESKADILKAELLKFGPDWKFNTPCPDTGEHMYAIGYGHAVADWRKLWKEGKCIETSLVPIILSTQKVAGCSKFVSKVIEFSSKYPDVQKKNAKLRAEATRDYNSSLHADKAEKRKESRELALTKKTQLQKSNNSHSIGHFLKATFETAEYSKPRFRTMADVVRRCGGGNVFINVLIPGLFGYRIFLFFRHLDDHDRKLVNKWAENTRNRYFELPDKSNFTDHEVTGMAIEFIKDLYHDMKDKK